MAKKSSPEGTVKTGFGIFAPARSFFTDSRQYFLAVAAALAAFGGIQIACAKMGLPRSVSWLALVPPLLVFLYKTVPRLWRARRDRILVRLSQKDDSTPRPATEPLGGYFVIGPYPEGRRNLFRRADGMHETILQWIRQSRERVLVLTGNSGTGKSSLLQAFVIPELREGNPPCTVMLVRSFDDPLVELRHRLAEPGVIWSEPPSDINALSWNELLPRAVKQLRRKNLEARLVVVLDQFEELVILDPADGSAQRVATMSEFLKCLRQQAPEGFTLLLSLRSDYKTFLEPLGVPPLQQSVNWEDVPAFRQGDATEFLSAPGTGFQMPAKRLQSVLTEAAALDGTRGLIRPIVLNMLGVVLRRIAGGPEAERPTRRLLADDIRQVVNHSVHRETLRSVLLRMLTDADTKRPRTVGELAQETGFDPHIIHGCLLDLELSGYVRPLSRSDEIVKRTWEISHDFIARLLGPILKTPFQTFWQRTVAVLYPVSITVWVLLLIAAISWDRGWERRAAETTLRQTFHFYIEDPGGFSLVKQDSPGDFDSSKLAQATSLFSKIPPVTNLDLSRCGELRNVDALKGLSALQVLDLADCYALRNVDVLEGLSALTNLDLSQCSALTNVDALKGLSALQVLDLADCYALRNVDVLKGLSSLTYLDLADCYRLENVDVLKGLSALAKLDLRQCSELTNVDGLKGLSSLTYLDLADCYRLKNVDGLKGLSALQALNLSQCSALTNVDGLKGLSALQALNLSGCGALTNVDALKGLSALTNLDLSQCSALTNVDVLKGLSALQALNLFGCSALSAATWSRLKTALSGTRIFE